MTPIEKALDGVITKALIEILVKIYDDRLVALEVLQDDTLGPETNAKTVERAVLKELSPEGRLATLKALGEILDRSRKEYVTLRDNLKTAASLGEVKNVRKG